MCRLVLRGVREARIFGDRRIMREWLGHLFIYSMTITLSGLYEGYLTLGQGLLKMVGDIEEIGQAMLTMPAQQVYHLVARELRVPPSTCFMVAAHVWDTVGAQSAGLGAGLVTRPGNAPLPAASLPQPGLVAPDLPALAGQLIRRRRS